MKYFLCPCCNYKVDVFIEHVNVFSAFPKFVSYKMSEEIVYCNKLENNFSFTEEVVSMTTGSKFCN